MERYIRKFQEDQGKTRTQWVMVVRENKDKALHLLDSIGFRDVKTINGGSLGIDKNVYYLSDAIYSRGGEEMKATFFVVHKSYVPKLLSIFSPKGFYTDFGDVTRYEFDILFSKKHGPIRYID